MPSSSRAGAVTQLEALGGDVSQLLAVADGAIYMLDLVSLKRRPPGGLDSKSVSFVAVNRGGRAAGGSRVGAPKLCVVTLKKRLRLFAWAVGGKQYSYVTELDVPEVPRAVAYFGTSLICGYSREYNIISEDGGHSVRDVTGLMGKETRPYIKQLPGDCVLIVQGEEVGAVIALPSGEPAHLPTLHFDHRPSTMAYCYPYLLSCGTAELEVHATVNGRDDIIQVCP